MNTFVNERGYLEYMPGVFWLVNEALEYLDIGGEKLTEDEINPEDIIGRTVTEYFLEDENGINTRYHRRAFQKGWVVYQLKFARSIYECHLRLVEEENMVIGVATDISERLKLEDIIEEQATEILEFSTPIVPILENAVVLPIVGEFSLEKADYIKDNVIGKIHEVRNVEWVIIDISGVSRFESETGIFIRDIHSALGLLGLKPLVTGIHPEVSKTIIRQGISLPPNIKVFSSVKQAIQYLL